MKTLVFSEDPQLQGELLAAAQRVKESDNVSAVLLGQNLMSRAQELINLGADHVYVIDHSALSGFQVETCVDALVTAVQKTSPSIVLIGASKRGKELAPRLAARLKTGCVADCIGLRVEEGQLLLDRVVYIGKAVASLSCSGSPVVCSVKPHVFEAGRKEDRKGEVFGVEVQLGEAKSRLVGREERSKGKVNLVEAKLIVSVGRGLKKKEDLPIIEELAEVMGAEVGCSRPLSSDLGWLPEEHHIGISGLSVKPQLYVAMGISGQLHHLVGIRDSRIIVAVNSDKDAPIFAASDYCVVGDLYKVVPELTKALKQAQGK